MISYAELIETLNYDPMTGVFTWKQAGKGRRTNKQVGSWDMYGYLTVRLGKAKAAKSYKLHRLAWLYAMGEWPKHDIDHLNGIRHDNRIENLRDAPRKMNLENQIKMRNRKNKTGLMGAYFDAKKDMYYSRISHHDKSLYLGSFKTAEEAHQCYLNAKRKIHEGCTV